MVSFTLCIDWFSTLFINRIKLKNLSKYVVSRFSGFVRVFSNVVGDNNSDLVQYA